jgi:hypothetical protein
MRKSPHIKPQLQQGMSVQDTKELASGYQVCGNERPDTELIAGFQIGIRGGARPFQLRGGSIKQTENFENSQDLKDRSENFKNP